MLAIDAHRHRHQRLTATRPADALAGIQLERRAVRGAHQLAFLGLEKLAGRPIQPAASQSSPPIAVALCCPPARVSLDSFFPLPSPRVVCSFFIKLLLLLLLPLSLLPPLRCAPPPAVCRPKRYCRAR